jgi:hypothetical protein
MDDKTSTVKEKNLTQDNINHNSHNFSIQTNLDKKNEIREKEGITTEGRVSWLVDTLADLNVFIYKKIGHLLTTPFRIVARLFDGIIAGGKKGKQEKGISGTVTGSFKGAAKGTSNGLKEGYLHVKQTLKAKSNEEIATKNLSSKSENLAGDGSSSDTPISVFIDRISFTSVEVAALKLYMYTAPFKAVARLIDGTTDGIVTGSKRGKKPLSKVAFASTGAVEGVLKGTVDGVKEGVREIGLGLESIVHSAGLIAKKFKKANKVKTGEKVEIETIK